MTNEAPTRAAVGLLYHRVRTVRSVFFPETGHTHSTIQRTPLGDERLILDCPSCGEHAHPADWSAKASDVQLTYDERQTVIEETERQTRISPEIAAIVAAATAAVRGMSPAAPVAVAAAPMAAIDPAELAALAAVRAEFARRRAELAELAEQEAAGLPPEQSPAESTG